MGKALTAVKRWLTYKMVVIAAQLDGGMFLRLCEVAIIAHYKEELEDVVAMLRLEQEHDYYYNHEGEYDDTDSDTTHSINGTSTTKPNRKFH